MEYADPKGTPMFASPPSAVETAVRLRSPAIRSTAWELSSFATEIACSAAYFQLDNRGEQIVK
jgi:hypothetical protein